MIVAAMTLAATFGGERLVERRELATSKRRRHRAGAVATAQAQRKALITGITGQDGSYLAELLVSKGYQVHGIRRRSSSSSMPLLDPILKQYGDSIVLHNGDMTDASSLARVIAAAEPDEVFNLAAQTHVAVSFENPAYTAAVNGLGTVHLLEAVRLASGLSASTSGGGNGGTSRAPRFYQASTSELFGGEAGSGAFTEQSPFRPRSPYGVSKLMAYWAVRNYREAYGMFACNGILFNHESPRRGEAFVTRKVSRAAAAVALGLQDCVTLGNLSAMRDWGHARDYVECMWQMLQRGAPDDYVVATGESRTVRELCQEAFLAAAGIELRWQGTGVEEVGVDASSGAVRVRVSSEFYRPAEVDVLLGDPSKAVRELGFNPRKTSFSELVREMVLADMLRLRGGSGSGGGGSAAFGTFADDRLRGSSPVAPQAAGVAPAVAPAEEEDWLERSPKGSGVVVDDTPFVWPQDGDDEDAFKMGGRFILPGELQ